MATEVIEIEIREKGGRATSNSIRKVGRESRTATRAVKLLGTALAAIGVQRVIKNLLETADAATRMSSQIKTVTTSTAEFNAVQSRLNTIANETRAPLEDTVGLYRRLRVATRDLGSSQEEVLQVTQGLAAAIAVSGATASEGSNALIQLAQGLASGRLQGDELRSVLENLPPLAQALADELGVTVGQLREMGEAGSLNAETIFPALLKVGAEFQAQLEDLPFTLEQASTVLSNTFTSTIGEINDTLAATEFLSGGILDLSTVLRSNLIDAFVLATRGTGVLFQATADLNENLSQMGVDVLPTLGQQFRVFGGIGSVSLAGLQVAFADLILAVAQLGFGFAVMLDTVGLLDEGVVELRQRDFFDAVGFKAETVQAASKSARELADVFLEIARNQEATGPASKRLAQQATNIKELADELERLQSAEVPGFDLTQRGEQVVGGAGALTAEQLRAEESAATRLVRLTDQLRIADQKRIEPLDAQLEKLRQQELAIIDAANASGDLSASSEGLLLIDNQRAEIERERATLIEQQAVAQAEIVSLIAQAADISPELAEQIQKAADAAVAAGGGLAEVNSQLGDIASQAKDDIEDANETADFFGTTLGRGVERGIGQAVRGALSGEGIDAVKIFTNIFSDLLTESLTSALKQGLSGLTGGLGGDGGGGLAAGITAGIAAGGFILAGALKDTSSSISNDLIKSAASQSEAAATRGVIAGPTNIPIFQVGQQLESALEETNDILGNILNAIVAGATTTGGATGGDTSATTLELATPSLS